MESVIEAIDFIRNYWTQIIFLFGVLIGLIKYMKNMIEATKCSLRNDMLTIYKNCKNEQISLYDLEAFNYSYNSYKKLKGNSFIDEINEKIKSYQIIY